MNLGDGQIARYGWYRTGWRCRRELDRVGPMAPSARIVLHPHACPISLAVLQRVAWKKGNGIVKRRQLARFPATFHFVNIGSVGIIVRHRRVMHLGDAPFEGVERATALWITKRRGLKGEAVDWEREAALQSFEFVRRDEEFVEEMIALIKGDTDGYVGPL